MRHDHELIGRRQCDEANLGAVGAVGPALTLELAAIAIVIAQSLPNGQTFKSFASSVEQSTMVRWLASGDIPPSMQ